MSLTLAMSVKEELSRLEITRLPACRAEVSTLLRFGGELRILSGRLIIQVEVPQESTARRLSASIGWLYGCHSEILTVAAAKAGLGGRYVIQVLRGSESLARQSGLLDRRGAPVQGLPPNVLLGSISEIEAVWRGAFLAQGSLTNQDRTSTLGITCPNRETALALVGLARRLGIEVKLRNVRGVERVTIPDHADVAAMLARMGAAKTLEQWEDRRGQKDVKIAALRSSSGFNSSNQRRSERASAAVAARVERALGILGDEVPASLRYSGELRLAHRHASLEELGRLADPPMNKDTIAGRIRRLLALAESIAPE